LLTGELTECPRLSPNRSIMAQTVWIARHGNRLDFVNPAWFDTAERRYDPPLSEDGLIQAQQLAARLKSTKIAQIFCSPFLRTIQTANEVALALNLPLKLEAGLSEWLNRDWMTEMPETQPMKELFCQYPSIDSSYTSSVLPQYPETEEMMLQRTAETAKKLVAEYSSDILLVGHAASVEGTAWGLIEENATINAGLCCLVQLVRYREKWELKLNGDTAHLLM